MAIQENNHANGANHANGQTTPTTISKTLYERVLSQQSSKKNVFGGSNARLSSNKKLDKLEDEDPENSDSDADAAESDKIIKNNNDAKNKFVNGPGRTQFEGLDEVPEVKSLRRSTKPKYVTIERHR